MRSRAKSCYGKCSESMLGSDTGNINSDIGRFHKDVLCNIYKNDMSFFTSETLFRKR